VGQSTKWDKKEGAPKARPIGDSRIATVLRGDAVENVYNERDIYLS